MFCLCNLFYLISFEFGCNDEAKLSHPISFGNNSNEGDSNMKKQFYNPGDTVKTKLADRRRKSHLDSGIQGLKALNLSEPLNVSEEFESKYAQKKNKMMSNVSTTFSEKRDAQWYHEYISLIDGDYPEGIDSLTDRIKYEFESKYINLHDPRIKKLIMNLEEVEQTQGKIEFPQFKQIMKPKYTLFRSILQNQVTIKNWEKFIKETQEIFEEVSKWDDKGFIPSYIPQLLKSEKDEFSVSICTIDGQIFNFGDSKKFACMHAISSVISFLIALEQHGQEEVSNYIGTEPSGKTFNSLELMNGKPHNPLINSGSLTSWYLMYQDETIDRKYEKYAKIVKRLIAGSKVHYNNEMYLSEVVNADRNYWLLYMLKEAGTIPEKLNVKKILEFYTQVWAIEFSIEKYAILAASLANGGIWPLTEDKIFMNDPNAIKGALSQMLSWGMNTYSGKWAFVTGLPAKSSVSGVIILTIPNTMGIAVYSPLLNKHYNSYKGTKFLEQFVNHFGFSDLDHVYGAGLMSKLLLKQKLSHEVVSESFHLLYYAKQGNLVEIRRSVAKGRDVNYADYDNRTPLHLAANYGHFKIVKYLVNHGAYIQIKDRFGRTPFDEATTNGYSDIAEYLQKEKEKQQSKASMYD